MQLVQTDNLIERPFYPVAFDIAFAILFAFAAAAVSVAAAAAAGLPSRLWLFG